VRAALHGVEVLASESADALLAADVAGRREAIGALLGKASELARAGVEGGPRRRERDRRAADLAGADLRGQDLRGANLRGALLIGADLRRARRPADALTARRPRKLAGNGWKATPVPDQGGSTRFASVATGTAGSFSPDGHWLVYTDARTGRLAVVRPDGWSV